jgi:hypothetical protein
MKTLFLITGCLLLIFSYAYVFQEPALASSFAGLKFTSSTKEVKEVCSKAGLKVVSEETKRDTTFDNINTKIVFAGAIDKSDYPVKFVETDCLFINDSLFSVYIISERGWYQDEKEELRERSIALTNLIAMEQYVAGKFGRQPDKVPETIPIWFLWYEGQLQIMVNMQMLPAYAICYSIIYTGMFTK